MTTRILHLIDTFGPGGAETVFHSLIAGLPPDSWESLAVTTGEGWLTSQLEATATPYRVVRSRGRGDIGYLWRVASIIRQWKPAIIHAHLLTPGVYGTMASLATLGPPVVCTLHGRPDIDPPSPLLPFKGRILSRDGNTVVYVSNDLRGYAEPLLHLPHRIGSVIHNGVPFQDVEADKAARTQLGATAESCVLALAVGNVRPAKDYETLVRAAEIACARDPKLRFAVAGDASGTLGRGIAESVRRAQLEHRFHLLGFRSDVSILMASCDIFVSSSASEGLPLATLEALGMGKPAVLTAVGGVPEIVGSDGSLAVLVPSGDPEALARGILRCAEDLPRSRAMGEEAAVSVRRRFSLSSMIASYERLYRSVLRQTESGGRRPGPWV